ncbi:MAG: hypothetical protein KKF12_12275 [Proteobacteria bacterium]|nr:hypothetical protein [Desulfobacula sp.]MBU3951021.1 hypothetical protein [Pseudomonadota bacterium]MBU4009516.1 hypothetical protein [Pseudomonadota bacterium]MBU4131589.1 hypothetical protein [Pseudomonadota bacterium]
MNNYIDLKLIKRKKISPNRYLKLSAKEKGNIEKCSFVAPKLGESGFGFFEIILKRPVYQSAHE